MEYCGTQRYKLSSTRKGCNASFIANNLLMNRGYYMNSSNTNAGSWNASKMREFVNNRVYEAMPTVWKSIIETVRISTTAGSGSQEIIYADDKIYIEGATAITGLTYASASNESKLIPWFTSYDRRVKSSCFVSDDANYYTCSSEPSTISTNIVKVGDVWIPSSSKWDARYILITAEDFKKGNFGSPSGNHGKYTQDGNFVWVSTYYFWVRTPQHDQGSAYYLLVMGSGYLMDHYGDLYNYKPSSILGILICFSI